MSERASAENWTCQVAPRDGRLLDIREMARVVHRVSNQFSLRGVEASVVGQVVRLDGRPAVRLSRTGEVLRLVPLRRKVQWDPQAKADRPMTAAERSAYDRLVTEWREKEQSVRLIGPLVAPPGAGPYLLEVREFSWLR